MTRLIRLEESANAPLTTKGKSFMAFCPNCGTQAAGAFCPNCGAAVAAGAGAAPPPPGAGAQQPYPQAQPLSAPGMSDNVAGALCYLGGIVTGIIFLLLAPYNQSKLVRFHAFQSIFLTVAWMALWIVLGVVTHGLILFVSPLIGLAGLVLWLYMMYTAFNNKKVKLPLIGDLAEKQA
jgi:uncharacterized membrane protein